MDMSKFSMGDKIALGGGVLAVVSFFLAWISASALGLTISASGMEIASGKLSFLGQSVDIAAQFPQYYLAYAAPVLGLLMIGAVFALKENTKKWALMALGAVTSIAGVYVIIQINEQLAKLGQIPAGASAGPGMGLYLLVLAGVLAIIGGWKSFEQA